MRSCGRRCQGRLGGTSRRLLRKNILHGHDCVRPRRTGGRDGEGRWRGAPLAVGPRDGAMGRRRSARRRLCRFSHDLFPPSSLTYHGSLLQLRRWCRHQHARSGPPGQFRPAVSHSSQSTFSSSWILLKLLFQCVAMLPTKYTVHVYYLVLLPMLLQYTGWCPRTQDAILAS